MRFVASNRLPKDIEDIDDALLVQEAYAEGQMPLTTIADLIHAYCTKHDIRSVQAQKFALQFFLTLTTIP